MVNGNKLHLVYEEPSVAQSAGVGLVYPKSGVAQPEEFGVSYNRISTPGQEDGTSLETQIESNARTAASVGVTVLPEHVITEVWSGDDPGRPGVVAVRRLFSSGVVQYVFVSTTDRLARDPWHVVEFIRFCKDHRN